MATKDITDTQVCQAVEDARAKCWMQWPYELLADRTGQCEKVCFRALERAHGRDLVNYGVSLRTAWLTEEGMALLEEEKP